MIFMKLPLHCILILALLTFSVEGRSFQGFQPSARGEISREWVAYKAEFVQSDGRVVDTANENISHSESQGYAMLFAIANRDLTTFSVIWSWTRTNLQVREDGLFAWKWDPSRPESPIADPNNATDGDLLIAWALLRAAKLWGNDRYREEGLEIARTVRRTMIRETHYGPIILPGGHGFERDNGVITNLSYWVFPALLDIYKEDPSEVWIELYRSGIRLCREARFGKWDLPPDWLLVSKSGDKLSLPENFEPIFGYNAIRIPLQLKWGGVRDSQLYEPYIKWAEHVPNILQLPDTVNLKTNEPGPYTVIPGMIAVYQFVANGRLNNMPPPRPNPNGESYFSASLRLLTHLARQEETRYLSMEKP